MLNSPFYKELEKKLPKPLYYLWGREHILLEEALLKSCQVVVPPHVKDFNYDVYVPASSPQEIIDTASSFPFMTSRRLVVIKDFHDFSAAQVKVLSGYLRKPCETTCMIVSSLKEPKKTIEAEWFVCNLDIREKEIPAWIKRRASDVGMRMAEDAVDALIESLGPDTGLLASEVQKLSLSGIKAVKEADVISSVGMMREYTPFNLIDAIAAGNRKRAFRILGTLAGKRASDSATAVLGALNWHYRQFYLLWASKGKRPSRMTERTYRTLLPHIHSFTMEKFQNVFKNLHDTDILIKSSGRPDIAMEILVVKLLLAGTAN